MAENGLVDEVVERCQAAMENCCLDISDCVRVVLVYKQTDPDDEVKV